VVKIPYEYEEIDITIDFVLRIMIRFDEDDERFETLKLTQRELLYDEIQMYAILDMSIEDDVAKPYIR